jgi:hypothetical protein
MMAPMLEPNRHVVMLVLQSPFRVPENRHEAAADGISDGTRDCSPSGRRGQPMSVVPPRRSRPRDTLVGRAVQHNATAFALARE